MVATIGVQMFNMYDEVLRRGMFDVLRQITDLGFHAVEVTRVNLDEAVVGDLARGVADLQVDVAALTVTLGSQWGGMNDLGHDYDHVVDTAARLGTRYLRIGMMPPQAMSTRAGTEEWAAACQEYAARLRREGITLCYHNHHVDLAKFADERIFDVVRRVAPDLMFEVDLFWVQRGGMAPMDMLAAYSGVCKLIHLKDYRITPIPPAAVAARLAGDERAWNQAWNDVVQFGELGTGNINWPAVIPAAVDAGADYLFIEQDDTYGRDPFDCLRQSRDYLRSIGYSESA